MSNRERVTLYRHYKGGLYRILHSAAESTNARAKPDRPLDLVVYVSLSTGKILVREGDEFFGEVEPGVRRFTPCLGDANGAASD
jgi:hypothetical protein